MIARGRPEVPPDSNSQAADVNPGDTGVIESAEPGRIELRVPPRMTLEEIIQRFRVDAPYDDAAIREEWQEEAAREVFGSRAE